MTSNINLGLLYNQLFRALPVVFTVLLLVYRYLAPNVKVEYGPQFGGFLLVWLIFLVAYIIYGGAAVIANLIPVITACFLVVVGLVYTLFLITKTSLIIDTSLVCVYKTVWSKAELAYLLREFSSHLNISLSPLEFETLLTNSFTPEELKEAIVELDRQRKIRSTVSLGGIVGFLSKFWGLFANKDTAVALQSIYVFVMLFTSVWGIWSSYSTSRAVEKISSIQHEMQSNAALGVDGGEKLLNLVEVENNLLKMVRNELCLTEGVMLKSFGILLKTLSANEIDCVDAIYKTLQPLLLLRKGQNMRGSEIVSSPEIIYDTASPGTLRKLRSDFLDKLISGDE